MLWDGVASAARIEIFYACDYANFNRMTKFAMRPAWEQKSCVRVDKPLAVQPHDNSIIINRRK